MKYCRKQIIKTLTKILKDKAGQSSIAVCECSQICFRCLLRCLLYVEVYRMLS